MKRKVARRGEERERRRQRKARRTADAKRRRIERSGLVEAIDERLKVLKTHCPYHESDQVLNIAFNAMSGGQTLDDIEQRRGDAAYLNALQTEAIPDPTTGRRAEVKGVRLRVGRRLRSPGRTG